MKFKGKSFIAIVLTPDPPYEAWFKEIDRIVARSPGFFIDRPIILDVRGQKIAIEDLETVLSAMADRSIRVMGIDGVAGTRLKPGMPPSFSGGRLTSEVPVPDAQEPQPDTAPLTSSVKAKDKAGNGAARSKAADPAGAAAQTVPAVADSRSILITEPVRSGQRILHPGGDVTVVGSVSSGAEVIAGGSIHVYGALRGRALAGVSGNGGARIFCSRLDAELVSINGLYKVADDFEGGVMNAPAQIRCEDETLVFEKLG
ncbi:MAG: septum site-determining protein MinC [Roseibium sp.]|nr:septum site-determining protein MinC [Roseibium sp.]